MTDAWVVGAHGLLGRAIVDASTRQGFDVHTCAIHWSNAQKTNSELNQFAHQIVTHDSTPIILWCAGAGVPSSPKEVFDTEISQLSRFLDALNQASPQACRNALIFYASSAGAVYAGVGGPPYSESAQVKPLAPYGHAKLHIEQLISAFTAKTGARALCGRISNLYGPGQDLHKSQGLISTLLMGSLTHRPTQIYVSLDTIRDYLFTSDAAGLILDCIRQLQQSTHGSTTIKILCSGQSTTIGALLGYTENVIGRRPLIVQGASALAKVQTRNLSMHSEVWPHLNNRTLVPMLDGIGRTFNDLIHQYSAASGRA